MRGDSGGGAVTSGADGGGSGGGDSGGDSGVGVCGGGEGGFRRLTPVTPLSSNSHGGRVTHSNPSRGPSWYPPCHSCGPCCTHSPLPLLLLPTDWSP